MEYIKKNKKILIYIALLMIYGIVILLRSSLSPGALSKPSVDSSVFIYIAKGINRGLIPYKDLFDHKGLLLYFINWVGIGLGGGTIGIWILELISMYVNFFLIWKITRLFTKSKMISFFTIVVTFITYINYFPSGEGNKVEEWCLPFIFTILYLCIKFLKNKPETVQKKMWTITGIATAAICWIQIKLVIVDIVFVGLIGIYLLTKKQFKVLFLSILYFCLGFIILSLPLLIYLVCNNALGDFFYDYIVFNFKYTEAEATMMDITTAATRNWLLSIVPSICLIVSLVALLKSKKDDENVLIIVGSIFFLLLSFFITTMSGKSWRYYGLACIPSFAYPIFLILNFFLEKKTKGISTFIIVSLVIINIFCVPISELIRDVFAIRNKERNDVYNALVEYIQKRTTKDDEIVVIGNNEQTYLTAERYTTSKYFYQTPIAEIDTKIADEFLEYLRDKKPKIIVSQINDLTISGEKRDLYFEKELFKLLDSYEKNNIYSLDKYYIWGLFIYERNE